MTNPHLRPTLGLLIVFLAMPSTSRGVARHPGKLVDAKSLRCTFSLNVTSVWKNDGPPSAALNPATLMLRFDDINSDDGTAKLKTGSMESEITARSAPGYLHLMQSFRSGPIYMTTVFERSGGKLTAVHSRHEYFDTPLAGATSSPEQYYGECEIVN